MEKFWKKYCEKPKNFWFKNWPEILLLILALVIFLLDFFLFKKFFKFEAIEFWKYLVGIGAFLSIFVAFRRVKISDDRNQSFSKQIENQTRSEQNQQFLDAVKLFKDTNLEIKKGALFHLENLALSSPAHRQRVLDFLNSLNWWMRAEKEKLEKLESVDFRKWKNEKIPLLLNEIVRHKKQILSAEIPKIFENIIRKHNLEFPNFTAAEKKEFALDFSFFIFPEIDFREIVFTQNETNFSGCLFLGNATFEGAKFETANFRNANFRNANFKKVKFQEANFVRTEFQTANFDSAKFQESYFVRAKFWFASFVNAELQKVYFLSAEFQEGLFWRTEFQEADFRKAKFQKAHFHSAKFQETYFQETDFIKCPIKGVGGDFMPLDLYERIKEEAFFSEEQIKHFEKLKKKELSAKKVK